MIKFNVKDFDIKQIAESGQCFRWNKVDENKYRGVFFDFVCEVEQVNEGVKIIGLTEEQFHKYVEQYFDLKRNYSLVKEYYKDDKILNEAIKCGKGIRILNQEKFETLISFIISANNNIPRIKKSIEKISERYGSQIIFNNETYYAFPNPEDLIRASEEDLRDCGVGFRDKYIKRACEMLVSGETDLNEISKLPAEKCKKELLKITGVGPKVAECVMLFSMQKAEAFPVDVWIKRIIEKLYLKKETPLKEIEMFSKDKFGKYAGIAQQYLFYYARSIESKNLDS